jgi:glutamine amidotransferase
LELRNTHPFEQAGRLFAHNGVIEDLPLLERRLGKSLESVQGDTDSERFFALITHETAAAGGDLATGIAEACTWVAANLQLLSINFILTTETGLWALRYPDVHELHVLERAAGEPLEHHSSLGSRVRSDHGASRPLVTIASEQMDDDPRWRLLESGELLHVGAELGVSSTRILDAPPARPLSLADLSARAQASQAKLP